MSKYNDIDMSKWRDYDYIETDTLWIIDKRDNSGVHDGYYHGNFVPQIPRQLFSRYTKKGDWILDPFVGSGTSLIEAQRMKRNSIGIDIQKDVLMAAARRMSVERDSSVKTELFVGNSRTIDLSTVLKKNGISKIHFVILHPPYWDIIKFSNNQEDLSNASSLSSFMEAFSEVVDNTTQYLEKRRYCAVVIGDKYANSQVIPLGFYCMNLMVQKGFLLKAILVKNFGDTKGKINQQGIWRYRALASDFYIFKHEYIFLFKKISQ